MERLYHRPIIWYWRLFLALKSQTSGLSEKFMCHPSTYLALKGYCIHTRDCFQFRSKFKTRKSLGLLSTWAHKCHFRIQWTLDWQQFNQIFLISTKQDWVRIFEIQLLISVPWQIIKFSTLWARLPKNWENLMIQSTISRKGSNHVSKPTPKVKS